MSDEGEVSSTTDTPLSSEIISDENEAIAQAIHSITGLHDDQVGQDHIDSQSSHAITLSTNPDPVDLVSGSGMSADQSTVTLANEADVMSMTSNTGTISILNTTDHGMGAASDQVILTAADNSIADSGKSLNITPVCCVIFQLVFGEFLLNKCITTLHTS